MFLNFNLESYVNTFLFIFFKNNIATQKKKNLTDISKGNFWTPPAPSHIFVKISIKKELFFFLLLGGGGELVRNL